MLIFFHPPPSFEAIGAYSPDVEASPAWPILSYYTVMKCLSHMPLPVNCKRDPIQKAFIYLSKKYTDHVYFNLDGEAYYITVWDSF